MEKKAEKHTQKLIGLFVIMLLVAFSRILPHPPNFSPVMALGLLGGAYCLTVKDAVAVVFGAMILSDVVIGFHPSLPAVYLTLAVVIFIGRKLREKRGAGAIAFATLGSSVLFFVVTNFSAWLELPAYPKTFEGLIASYTAAIPFFRNSLIGDVLYVAILFGGLKLLERREQETDEEALNLPAA